MIRTKALYSQRKEWYPDGVYTLMYPVMQPALLYVLYNISSFGKPSFDKFRNSDKSPNRITFTFRLNVFDKKRKSRRSTTTLAQTTYPSLQP